MVDGDSFQDFLRSQTAILYVDPHDIQSTRTQFHERLRDHVRHSREALVFLLHRCLTPPVQYSRAARYIWDALVATKGIMGKAIDAVFLARLYLFSTFEAAQFFLVSAAHDASTEIAIRANSELPWGCSSRPLFGGVSEAVEGKTFVLRREYDDCSTNFHANESVGSSSTLSGERYAIAA